MKRARDLIDEKMSEFTLTLEQNEKKLEDKSVGYHEYFATVYRLERQRILAEQLKMIDYAHNILDGIQKEGRL
jgi:hypothetical protein